MATSSGKSVPYEVNKSCETCRGLKIRCLPSELETSNACQRCIRLDLECVYARPAKRRPRKRTDAKVAGLEREVRLLSSIIRQQYESPASPAVPTSSSPQASQQHQVQSTTLNSTALQRETLGQAPTDSITNEDHDRPIDLIQSGLVSHDLAEDIFKHFVTDFIPCFPILAFADGVNMDVVRAKRPILFFSIIATASIGVDPSLAPSLHEKLASFLAVSSMVVTSSPSVDLLQALMVATHWFHPGNKFDGMKYQQYMYMAAGVASQIDSARKSKSVVSEDEQLDTLELPRALTSCFILCAGISRSLHRSSTFPLTRRVKDCVHLLASSPAAVPNDRLLVLWAQQNNIMCEAATALGVNDASVDVDIAEARTQQILQTYDNQLEAWYLNLLEYSNDSRLSFIHHVNRLKLHEIALYCDYDRDDFIPPFAVKKLSLNEVDLEEWTAAHTRSISLCWTCGCNALDLFLGMPIDLLRPSPNGTFIRVVSCIIVLLKISASAGNRSKLSTFQGVLEQEYPHSHVISYIDRCVSHLEAISEGGRKPMAERLSFVVKKLKDWNPWHDVNEPVNTSEEALLQPLQDLSLHRATENFNDSEIPNSNQKSVDWTGESSQRIENLLGTPPVVDWASLYATTDNSTAFLQSEGQPLSASQLPSQGQIDDFLDFDPTMELDLQLSPASFEQNLLDFPFNESVDNQAIFDWTEFVQQTTSNENAAHGV